MEKISSMASSLYFFVVKRNLSNEILKRMKKIQKVQEKNV